MLAAKTPTGLSVSGLDTAFSATAILIGISDMPCRNDGSKNFLVQPTFVDEGWSSIFGRKALAICSSVYGETHLDGQQDDRDREAVWASGETVGELGSCCERSSRSALSQPARGSLQLGSRKLTHFRAGDLNKKPEVSNKPHWPCCLRNQ